MDKTRFIETNNDEPVRLLNLETELVDPKALKLHEANPRQGDVGALSVSYKENGFYGQVIVNKSDSRVLAGNHRVKAALTLGMAQIPVQYIHTDGDMHAIKILLADNRHSDLADYDRQLLAELLVTVADSDLGLPGTGYDGDDLDDLLRELSQDDEKEADQKVDLDKAAEFAEKWGVKPGQLWKIGKHRLLCGDSTSPDDVARLLNGASPRLMVTDPPYGVNYDQDWRSENRSGKVENDDKADWREAYELSPADVWYVWHASRHASTVQDGIVACGFEHRAQIIWAKPALVFSQGHYHWQHEPCWYAVRKGSSADWLGDRKQTTLWAIEPDADAPGGHGTQKPLECMERPIRNHRGDVYEPFAGSGTTIVAAQRQDRVCYAMEIDPGYVGAILERLSLMGLEPELDEIEEEK